MDRKIILKEFWSLRNSLNRGNKLVNEKTDLKFKIEKFATSEYRLLVSVLGSTEEIKIEISRRDRRGNWDRSGFSNSKALESYCAEFLNAWEDYERSVEKRNAILLDSDINAMTSCLKREFESLLLNQAP